eukprot:TRINITY_DN73464_c0_g1_i1.p1 TRINITY_DN73464_c0_g1~~TRINITY_DN73464_c0_g1_i1.p1  ORF type:complete len:362 (-),score=80.18 TRINITY_DN73464_c0_g1_i1:92-1177(-)
MASALPAGGALSSSGGLAGAAALREWPDLHRPRLLDLQQLFDCLAVSPLAPPTVQQVVQKMHATAYPPNWSEELDAASGALYFYNRLLDDASWDHPLARTFRDVIDVCTGLLAAKLTNPEELAQRIEAALLDAQQQAVTDLQDWVGPLNDGSPDGPYFYHSATQQSTWEDPRERWQYDLQVRYELLVGFLVAEERRMSQAAAGMKVVQALDLTPTLTSLASSMDSMASTLHDALSQPDRLESGASAESRWARPRRAPRPQGSLALPPRVTGRTGEPRPLYMAAVQQQAQQRQAERDAAGEEEEEIFSFRAKEQEAQNAGAEDFSFRGRLQAAGEGSSPFNRSLPPPPPPGSPPGAAQGLRR